MIQSRLNNDFPFDLLSIIILVYLNPAHGFQSYNIVRRNFSSHFNFSELPPPQNF